MEFGGILPEDAPDPRWEQRRQLRAMPVPVIGLVPQPSVEDTDTLGIGYGEDDAGYSSFSVDITYTLWRNPRDRTDPINLATLDDELRAALETTTPWPRPPWLLERLQRMRYPQLWEAVRTTWSREVSEHTGTAWQLAEHLANLTANHYRDQSQRPWPPPPPPFHPEHAQPAAPVEVDGIETPAVEIDTDPQVYAVGFAPAPHTVVTAVLPRAELGHLRVAFATRPAVSTPPTRGW